MNPSLPKYIPLNLNNTVKVKLTPRGLDILKTQHELVNVRNFLGQFKPPKVDEQGYTTFQLHALLSTFGEYIHLACDLPFETEILINSNEDF